MSQSKADPPAHLHHANHPDVNIELHKDVLVAGSELTGVIRAQVRSRLARECITAEISGKAICMIKNSPSEELLFRIPVDLPLDGSSTVEPGLHEWGFRIRLPADIPPSVGFNANNRIYYTFKASIKDEDVATSKSRFRVFAPLSEAALRLGATNEVTKEATKSFTFGKGTCTLHVRMPGASCFVPGLKVPLTISVDNQSSRTVKAITIVLVEYVSRLESDNRGDIKENIVREVIPDVTVAKASSLDKLKYALQIPANIQPTVQDLRHVFRLSHTLKVRCSFFAARDLKVKIPVTVYNTVLAADDGRTREPVSSSATSPPVTLAGAGVVAGVVETAGGPHGDPVTPSPSRPPRQSTTTTTTTNTTTTSTTTAGSGAGTAGTGEEEVLVDLGTGQPS